MSRFFSGEYYKNRNKIECFVVMGLMTEYENENIRLNKERENNKARNEPWDRAEMDRMNWSLSCQVFEPPAALNWSQVTNENPLLVLNINKPFFSLFLWLFFEIKRTTKSQIIFITCHNIIAQFSIETLQVTPFFSERYFITIFIQRIMTIKYFIYFFPTIYKCEK